MKGINDKSLPVFFRAISLFILVLCGSGFSEEGNSLENDGSSGYLPITDFNVRSNLLQKNEWFFSVGTDKPHYYKTYTPRTKNLEKISSKAVWNETYFNSFVAYGVSGRFNLALTVPILDVRHISPMGEVTGAGLGDIEAGIDFSFLKKEKNKLASSLVTGFPTGQYKGLKSSEYPLGIGVFRFKFLLTGEHKFNSTSLLYSGYYEYRVKSSLVNGDEIGGYLFLRRPVATSVGRFGVEGGGGYRNIVNTNGVSGVRKSVDNNVSLFLGGWYCFLEGFNIYISFPYTIYESGSWITERSIDLRFDYLLKQRIER